MPKVSGGTGGSDLVVYPLDHIRDTAAKILAQAGEAQAQHDQIWQHIQDFITSDIAKNWQVPLMDCLNPYAARLRATYDWQINLASALFDLLDAIEGTENQNTGLFAPRHGQQPVP